MAQSVSNIGIKGFRSQGSTNLEIEGVDELKQRLEYIQTKDPQMKRTITKIVREAMNRVYKKMQAEAKGAMNTDPKQAYRALNKMVYKRIFGGNVNILTGRRKRADANVPEAPGRGHLVGGNRMKRSATTQRMLGYWGEDRGMILRWLNMGTDPRESRCGNRGSIAATRWFSNNAPQAMYDACQMITETIDEVITEVWGEKALGRLTGTTTHNTI